MNKEIKPPEELPGMPLLTGIEDPYFETVRVIQLVLNGAVKYVFPPEMAIVKAYRETRPEDGWNIYDLMDILKVKNCRCNAHFARVCMSGVVTKVNLRPLDATITSILNTQAGKKRKFRRRQNKKIERVRPKSLHQNHLQMTAGTAKDQSDKLDRGVLQITRYVNGGAEAVLYKGIEETDTHIIVDK
jgi:hypothetical protein